MLLNRQKNMTKITFAISNSTKASITLHSAHTSCFYVLYEQTVILSFPAIKKWWIITETEWVYCAVCSGSLN
jgi:hypothetical protein